VKVGHRRDVYKAWFKTDSDFDPIRDDDWFRAVVEEDQWSRNESCWQKFWQAQKIVQFDEMVSLVEAFGFQLSRVSGSHHIFQHPTIPELVNLQNKQGKAKP
jgi:predicted RNA binding protein YcfA (HicA-like mRNA interferase family)